MVSEKQIAVSEDAWVKIGMLKFKLKLRDSGEVIDYLLTILRKYSEKK